MQLFNFISLKKKQEKKKAQKHAQERVYLDYAASTPLGGRAKRALLDTLSLHGNPSAIYKEGVEAQNLVKAARTTIARIINCKSHELYFTSTGTESITLAISGAVEYYHASISKLFQEKTLPHIITTQIEHSAVLELLRHLELTKKITVTYLPVTQDGLVTVRSISEALTDATILVACMYANNEIGTIQPVKEIGRMLAQYREKKYINTPHGIETSYPLFYVDACQAANYLPLDAKRLHADMMTVNSSKVYGPKGIALLYKREGVMILPTTFGGGQERGLRSGTEAVPLIHAFAEALEEAQELRITESERLLKLRVYTTDLLQREIPSIVFYGTYAKDMRLVNNINCGVPYTTSEEMILRLDAAGFSVSHKSACASRESDGSYVLLALGATEEESLQNIRITLGRDTTEKDIYAFVQAMKMIVAKYAGSM